jgi:hypothetical protein
MIAAAVERWFAARDVGLDRVLLAGTNDIVDRLNQAVIDRLAAAIAAGEPWLRAALCVVADGHTTSLGATTIESLETLAATRDHNHIPPTAPLDACAPLLREQVLTLAKSPFIVKMPSRPLTRS